MRIDMNRPIREVQDFCLNNNLYVDFKDIKDNRIQLHNEAHQ